MSSQQEFTTPKAMALLKLDWLKQEVKYRCPNLEAHLGELRKYIEDIDDGVTGK